MPASNGYACQLDLLTQCERHNSP